MYFQDHFQKPNPFEPHVAIDITPVIDKKIHGLDAHVSQFYEWLPWIAGYADEVPEGKEERIAWLKEKRGGGINDEVRKSLEKWYGPAKAAKAQYAEAFEVCEYGSQPSDEELKRLFPMLGK